MAWDDELEQLVGFVHDHFGEEEFGRALARAIAVARGGSASADLFADDGTIASTGTVIPMETYYEALRTELRRLARPH